MGRGWGRAESTDLGGMDRLHIGVCMAEAESMAATSLTTARIMCVVAITRAR